MFSLSFIKSHQQEVFIRTILVLLCLGLWYSVFYKVLIPMLIVAWLLDGGISRSKSLLQEPLVQAILVLCALLFVGLLWGGEFDEGRHKWRKYFLLLIYIPFFGLLNQARLPWVIGALCLGYGIVLFTGLYEWLAHAQQGIPLLKISYLGFSAILGIGAIVSCCFAFFSKMKANQALFSMLTIALLYVQFHQNARGFLLATLLTILLLIVLHFRVSLKKLVVVAATLVLLTISFAYHSDTVQERWAQAENDWVRLQAGHYDSSIGYRLAMWDVGLHGIAQQPFIGYGTGMATSYFDQTILSYKDGVYQELPDFQSTEHFHNDWIEIGVHLGLLGISALFFLLWSWYRTFSRYLLVLPGVAMVSFVVLSGLTEVLLIFYRIPVLLLVVTAIAICWQKNQLDTQQLG